MALVTALGGTSDLASALRDEEAAVVVYKGGRYLEEVSALLAKAERADDAVVGELLGLPGERISPLREVADRPASYLVTVISPPRRRTEGHPG
jgi:precorrin-2 methylase